MQDQTQKSPRVTILGAGSIGLSFAAAFSDAGATVTLVDPDADHRAAVQDGLAAQRSAMEKAGLARGANVAVNVVGEPDAVMSLCDMVLECGPEKLEAKRAIFQDLLARSGKATLLATASSAITMSQIVPDVAQQRRCLVAHPVNPPAVLRIVELVPAPGTAPATIGATAKLFQALGFDSVELGREIEGFVLNRLQSAVLREAYRLVDEGITDADGIDAIMRMGLGPRWALSGPFETAELNTPGGIKAHAARMGPAYKRIGEARGETVDWNKALVDRIDAQRRQHVAVDGLPQRAKWRAGAVAKLVAERDKLLQDDS